MAWLILIIGAGIMGICMRVIRRALFSATKKDRLIAGIDKRQAANLTPTDGLVAVSGVTGGTVQRHPLLDVDVVHYEIRVEERYRHAVQGSDPKILKQERFGDGVDIVDGDDRVRVPLVPLTLEFANCDKTLAADGSPAVVAYLNEHDIRPDPYDDQKHVVVRTDWVPAGVPATAVGFVDGDAIVSRPAWEAVLGTRSAAEIQATHKSSAGALKIALIGFALLGAGHLLAGAAMLFAP